MSFSSIDHRVGEHCHSLNYKYAYIVTLLTDDLLFPEIYKLSFLSTHCMKIQNPVFPGNI